MKIILLNNSFLGMVRQWQELFFDKRYSFTEMTNPDFGAIAQGNGIAYRCVEKRDELETAIHAMKEHPEPFCWRFGLNRKRMYFRWFLPVQLWGCEIGIKEKVES